MDSSIDIAGLLIEEGKRFTFSSFSMRTDKSQGEWGGADTPEWLAWKTRSLNFIKDRTADTSPAIRLANGVFAIQTEGFGPENFERAKSTVIHALTLTLSALQQDVFGELRTAKAQPHSPSLSSRVFVVHGHDDGLKTDLERFLREIGLEPVVLHRQVDQGQTVIEKFEANSDVGYAFVLLTPDEIAYLTKDEDLPDASRRKERRARPNVIFEFGYFVGKLGRGQVCCLYREPTSLPSDLAGLIYKKIVGNLDEQAYSIIRELKSAGYKVNV